MKIRNDDLNKEKTDEAHYIHTAKMKTFVIFKSLSLNKTQIKKFDYFLINSIAIDALN